ncbi:solute:sodium symporter family transporter [Parvularcula lutaonensis]|uniref:Solute:sodium symporter family transporter n=1 Tax=Parvularcula lutaonensis TaxID=491923 RepID=A0ABV7MC09_9PROT|nr:solute:sodium symporter family transporter [Parvularcula lutaonensis]GGY48957.1 solute:sodium symporter family transporter [Parvularcula lutaonensis]
MDNGDLVFTALSSAFFMGLVAWISYLKTRGEVATKDGYFLAGHGLSAGFIAGSLLLTNLSAEQMIGLNGSAYGANLSSMGWEVTAAIASIAMALIFLPKYLRGAFTTLPEFLSDRFDEDVRRLSALLFIIGYGLVTIPSVLYSGSLAVMALFDVEAVTGLAKFPALVLTVIVIGLIGAIYAIFGGLRAVAISDTLNGVGLLIVGVAVPVLGLLALGQGDIVSGLRTLTQAAPEKLNAIGSETDPTPFGTIFTGMVFANLFYWCTNQYVIQRVLGGASLKESQKGVLLAGFFKVMVPFMMMIPGVIAFHLYGPALGGIDEAYPRLVSDVLPKAFSGFFLAVLLGAVFSSFNSLLNSAATLFTLDILAPLRKREPSEADLIHMAKIASVVIAVFSFAAAPMLSFAEAGLWQVIRVFTGFYNIPIIAIVIVGIFTKRVPPLAAKVMIGFHLVAYGLLRFAPFTILDIHFIHQYAVLFAIEVALMLAIGRWKPSAAKQREREAIIDMTPWRFAGETSLTLASAVVLLYLVFSPLGAASEVPFGSAFWAAALSMLGINAAFWARAIGRKWAAPASTDA